MASPSRVLPWVPYAFTSRRCRRVVSPERRLTEHRRGSACSGLPRALVAIRNAIRWYRLVSEALLKESSEILTNPRGATRVRCHVTATGEVEGVVRTMDRGRSTGPPRGCRLTDSCWSREFPPLCGSSASRRAQCRLFPLRRRPVWALQTTFATLQRGESKLSRSDHKKVAAAAPRSLPPLPSADL